MNTNCRHGGDERYCSICLSEVETKPLEPHLAMINEQPHIILRGVNGNSIIKVMSLNKANAIYDIDMKDSGTLEFVEPPSKKILKRFLNQSLDLGYLFLPDRPLTQREQTDHGPSRCQHCKTPLSFDHNTLGCKQCRQYICHCGQCLCGYSGGFNYLKQEIPPQPPPPCGREERVEFIRVVRMVLASTR